MRRYLRPYMKEELGDLAYDALNELEYLYAVVWTHFDPSGDRGDKDQPPEVKKALRRVPKVHARHGLCMEGHEKEGEEVE